MLLRQRVYLPVFATVSLFLFALIAAASGLIQSGKKTALVDSERQAYRFVSGAEVALNRSLLGVDVMLAGMTDPICLSNLLNNTSLDNTSVVSFMFSAISSASFWTVPN